ncbi:cyclic GMP-AMP synthase-like receptor isoform X3 [Condylostylus longicornis]|uniref:cyclic GMP-AMP synthase-like receptor isoform X3 n=1 Tax=Condylostylus longicornis TaxID=2530218 RepID=UPI00244E3194|nr:cyclic GMP-AMP synthase-like receptor isoform X3 [Condylostylus longicornis]
MYKIMESKNLDNAFHKINRFISFEPGDRKIYMEDLECITKFIIGKLKNHDKVFEKLYNGHYFQGSYMDNLKIKKPDEYDIIIQMKLPKFDLAIITADPNKAGNVLIDITKILETMPKNTATHNEIYKRLTKSTDEFNFLDQKKISSWFQSMFYNILGNNSTVHLNINGTDYKLDRKVCGPAQTIKIYNKYKNISISIDYVPAFIFTESQWVAKRGVLNEYSFGWLAIPKPDYARHNDKKPNLSFRSSFSTIEREMIWGENQLKNVCKLIKKLRDRWNIQNLKSYHIKTLFLWENEIQNKTFWNKPTSYLFMHMFQRLVEGVKNGTITFFWDWDQNMLDNLTSYQLNTMFDQLKAVYDKIEKLRQEKLISTSIYEIFLTKSEIDEMNRGNTLERVLKNENSTSQNETNSPNINYGHVENNESSSTTGLGTIGAISLGIGALTLGALYLFGSNRNQN